MKKFMKNLLEFVVAALHILLMVIVKIVLFVLNIVFIVIVFNIVNALFQAVIAIFVVKSNSSLTGL